MRNKITETAVASDSKIAAGLPGWHKDLPHFYRGYLGLTNMLKTMGAVATTDIVWTKGRNTNAH